MSMYYFTLFMYFLKVFYIYILPILYSFFPAKAISPMYVCTPGKYYRFIRWSASDPHRCR